MEKQRHDFPQDGHQAVHGKMFPGGGVSDSEKDPNTCFHAVYGHTFGVL